MKKFMLAFILILCAHKSFAHGVGYRQSGLKAVALEFFYSTGEKMSYREAKVFSPKDNKFAVQSGRTDEEGRFAFVPDCEGEWRVIVRDEEGHQCEAKINVSDINIDVQAPVQEEHLYIRALLGVSIIFNIAMLVRRRR